MAPYGRNKGALPYRVPLCGPCSFTRRPCQEFRHSGMEVIKLASFNFLLWLDFRVLVLCHDKDADKVALARHCTVHLMTYRYISLELPVRELLVIRGNGVFRWTINVLVFYSRPIGVKYH
jgi:hypothetical protein